MFRTHILTGLHAIPVAILVVGALGLNGCMLMHMAHGGHGSHGGHQAVEGIVKEREADDFIVRLEVPALYAGQEAHLRVKIIDVRQSKFVEAERVLVRVQRQGETDEALVEKDAAGSLTQGVYQVKHTFAKAGLYDISATADLLSGQARQMDVTVTQEVAEHAGKSPKKLTKPFLILGGIGMGLMMVLMVL